MVADFDEMFETTMKADGGKIFFCRYGVEDPEECLDCIFHPDRCLTFEAFRDTVVEAEDDVFSELDKEVS